MNIIISSSIIILIIPNNYNIILIIIVIIIYMNNFWETSEHPAHLQPIYPIIGGGLSDGCSPPSPCCGPRADAPLEWKTKARKSRGLERNAGKKNPRTNAKENFHSRGSRFSCRRTPHSYPKENAARGPCGDIPALNIGANLTAALRVDHQTPQSSHLPVWFFRKTADASFVFHPNFSVGTLTA
eukprot:gene6435-4639_t